MEEKLDILLTRTERIERGLYGDEENGVKGLIHDHKTMDKRVAKIEKRHWYERGIWAGIGAVIAFFKQS